MAEEQVDLRGMVEDIVRAGQAEEYWSPDPDMAALLYGLAGDDSRAATMGLSCLWGGFIEYPNVFQPVVPAS